MQLCEIDVRAATLITLEISLCVYNNIISV
eukprot:COSAG01_NODE_45148_length_412_cov_0.686901_1_plen_29_part_10